MDVELARPDPLSFDSLVAVLGLTAVGFGAVRVFTQVGTQQGTVGWALIALGWMLVFPRLFLSLALTDEAVEVSVVSGKRTVDLDEVTSARVVDGRLALRLGGVGASGYHTGHFHLTGYGRVKAYASCFSGPFVVLERREGRPVVVSPADPEAFLKAVEERRGRG